MKKIAILMIGIWVLTANAVIASHPTDFEKNWHQWRGPYATGAAPADANPPIEWSESQNIRWKTAIPGSGHATPIVWGNKIFLQTAIEMAVSKAEKSDDSNPFANLLNRDRGRGEFGKVYKFELLAINRADGDILWRKTLREAEPHEGTHPTASFASNSPVTDGEFVYAYFGSRGLYCVDMDGNLKWEKDIGLMYKRNTFGEGSCPALYGDTLVIVQDHEGDSFITALDKQNGEVRWKTDRNERTTWASPIIVEQDGKPQVIMPATNRSRSYGLETGEELWECEGMTRNAIPTPVASNGFVYLTSGFRGSALQAIQLEKATGNVKESGAIVWEHNRNTPYVPSPLLYEDTIYFLKSNDGILSAFNIKTGEAYYGPKRLPGISGVYASVVGASERVYIASQNGTVLVIKHGATFEVLAENRLDEGFNASPAIVGSELYLRGENHLYCIAE